MRGIDLHRRIGAPSGRGGRGCAAPRPGGAGGQRDRRPDPRSGCPVGPDDRAGPLVGPGGAAADQPGAGVRLDHVGPRRGGLRTAAGRRADRTGGRGAAASDLGHGDLLRHHVRLLPGDLHRGRAVAGRGRVVLRLPRVAGRRLHQHRLAVQLRLRGAARRRGRRPGLPASDRAAVLDDLAAGGHRLPGPGRFPDGPGDEPGRAGGPGVRGPAVLTGLRGAGDHGHPHAAIGPGPDRDHDGRTADDLLGPAAGLRAADRPAGRLRHPSRAGRGAGPGDVRALPARRGLGHVRGVGVLPDRARPIRPAASVLSGDAALPDPLTALGGGGRVVGLPDLPAQGRQDHPRHDGGVVATAEPAGPQRHRADRRRRRRERHHRSDGVRGRPQLRRGRRPVRRAGVPTARFRLAD